MALEKATFGGGCFWCVEAIFQLVGGVKSVVSGYAGGETDKPDYESVCSGKTGHAEVVQIEYDAGAVSFEKLLDIFFKTHDPTTLNRQGNDTGTQYRSIILAHSPLQEEIARSKIKDLNQGTFKTRPVVTEVILLKLFYPAEKYHQNYFQNNPEAGYCRLIIAPKVQKFQALQ